MPSHLEFEPCPYCFPKAYKLQKPKKLEALFPIQVHGFLVFDGKLASGKIVETNHLVCWLKGIPDINPYICVCRAEKFGVPIVRNTLVGGAGIKALMTSIKGSKEIPHCENAAEETWTLPTVTTETKERISAYQAKFLIPIPRSETEFFYNTPLWFEILNDWFIVEKCEI